MNPDSVGLMMGLRVCLSNTLPGDAHAPEPHFELEGLLSLTVGNLVYFLIHGQSYVTLLPTS